MDVLKILDRTGVEYVDHGPNVAKGNVNIQCPWCGSADHSHHLGINIEKGYWGCWRDRAHRGRKLYKLVSRLMGVSYAQARRITGEGRGIAVQRDSMENVLLDLSSAPDSSTGDALRAEIRLPKQFRPLASRHGPRYRVAERFLQYVRDRGFGRDAGTVCRRYKLRYCVEGDFANRIIIPVYERGQLMTYLGRSIYKDSTLRYRALSKEESVKQVKDCVYNFDRALEGGEILVIVEGALDAMKVDFYGHRRGLRAVGLFNMNVEDEQAELLYELRGLYNRFIILLDQGEVGSSLSLEEELSQTLKGIKTRFLPEGIEDPGALSPSEAEELRKWL